MRFDCGEDWASKYNKLIKWHQYFAWFPIRVGNHDCRWFETIERKGETYYGGDWLWEYRARKV